MSTLSLDQVLQQALTHHRAGALPQAERLYRAILQKQPNHPDASHNYGLLKVALNKTELALPFFKLALETNPNQAQYWLSYIDALIQTNQLDIAQKILRQAEKRGLQGKITEELAARLLELKLKNTPAKKVSAYNKQSHNEPSETQTSQLSLLFNRGDYSTAEQYARDLIQRFPEHGFGWQVLGAVLGELGRLEESLEVQRKSLELLPNDADSFYNLGNTLTKLDRMEEAERNYRQAIAIRPNYVEAYNNLALTLQELGRLNEAIKCFRQTIALKADNAQVFYNLGITLQELSRFSEAEIAYRQAIAIDSNHAQTYNNLGNTLKEVGRLQEAEECYRTAITIEPDYLVAQSNLLYSYDYKASYYSELRLTEAKHYGAIAAKKVSQRYSSWQCESQTKCLRIGFVSGDYRNHPVGYFLENLLTQLDATKYEAIAYSSYQKNDELTERIKPYFAEWKLISGLSDEVAAQTIHNDGVHILVDLSGHTAHNRLPLFAWKPAPIQVTWLGYWASTGVVEMDYILVDNVGVPENSQRYFTEKVRYLPDTRLCFSAPKYDIAITALPALKNGYITFGCFQNSSKVTDMVLELWGELFAKLPTARLRFQSEQLRDGKFSKLFYSRLADYGIDMHRISMYGASSREKYLAAHSQVDIILDTFPYTGSTTTCEALWMGVPTLTLAGETLLARQGASLLSATGLNDWIANDQESYIGKAIAFSSNFRQLAKLRAQLRERVLASPLFDAQRFARNFENALREVWQEYQS